MGSISIFDVFLAGIGLYALISGIIGHGRLFTTQNIKEGCEKKIMVGQRVLYIIVGLSMVLNGLMSILLGALYDRSVVDNAYVFVPKSDLGSWSFLTPQLLSVMTFVFMGISLVSIIVLVVLLRKMTVRASAQKSGDGKAGDPAAQQHFMPSAAFEFEDEPKKNETKQ